MYAQVQSIAPNTSGNCGSAPGCQLGVWATTNGGTTWSFMEGSQGPSLGGCGFDYPQNWYDQGLAVDPNNPDRLFVDTYDIWFASRTGSTLNNLTCGYQGSSGHVVHVDQHALAFVNGSSSILLVGSDGGAFSTLNANVASDTERADLDQHGRRPEHDRVLLGRHQRLLRNLAEPRRPPGAHRTTRPASPGSRAIRPDPCSGR